MSTLGPAVPTGDSAPGAFTAAADYVRVFNNGTNWVLGGSIAAGVATAEATCIDVNEDDGSWYWQAGTPGGFAGPLSNVPGTTCGLTGIRGPFTYNSYSDGVVITYNSALSEFQLNVENGKGGWATCVR
jgi:hypothetical protein